MREQYETVKMRKSTRRDLRVLCALTGATITDMLDSLVKERLQEMGRENKNANQPRIQNKTAPDAQPNSAL